MDKLLKKPGNYRRCNIYVGGYGKMHPHYVKKETLNLIKKINKSNNPSIEELLNMHCQYETIHPFVDGNGRSGRLLLNWTTLHFTDSLYIIDENLRGSYYQKIKDFEKDFVKENPDIKYAKNLRN